MEVTEERSTRNWNDVLLCVREGETGPGQYVMMVTRGNDGIVWLCGDARLARFSWKVLKDTF